MGQDEGGEIFAMSEKEDSRHGLDVMDGCGLLLKTMAIWCV